MPLIDDETIDIEETPTVIVDKGPTYVGSSVELGDVVPFDLLS